MIAACLCFKDSAQYLDEWLRFHRVQGFGRFYLYDNESSDDWERVVAPWIEKGLVVTKKFPGRGVQGAIYDDCLGVARGEADWLAFLDDDEFLFPVGEESLEGVLGRFADTAGIAVNWMLYGSSGYDAYQAGWVTGRFVNRHPGVDPHVKCIVRPERIVRSRIIGHAFETASPFSIVDEKGVPTSEPFSASPTANVLRINHYLVKSWEEWRVRRMRPQANTGAPTPLPESAWREWDGAWSSFEDRSALKFHPQMKACFPGEALP